MRRIIAKVTMLAAILAISSVPVIAAETGMEKGLEQNIQGDKNECLLVAMNCGNQVDSIQQRIERIKGEIAKGTDVYSSDELRRLNRSLEEAEKLLESQSFGG